ncbi:Hrf1 family protein [Cryptosporidium muris RN66]|uniref:Protein YIF1 n=1 Tax=Cryptosporidium muris (strain RN66) TaxID=441375 RepID=B6AA10_CRYMR|nr:Hrf1 family protein [Cryptosporidium muris RN66]EEA05051.1 Hrf1 family protein [Cryptosporidium muris RN66]|eukprot:XP_002139400.1 Hrf1 family protein [Cryptosporidium muris RN66]
MRRFEHHISEKYSQGSSNNILDNTVQLNSGLLHNKDLPLSDPFAISTITDWSNEKSIYNERSEDNNTELSSWGSIKRDPNYTFSTDRNGIHKSSLSTTIAGTQNPQFNAPFEGAIDATSQFVMGFVANKVKETTGVDSEQISQLQLWFPNTIALLRRHFAVSHEYVARKLFLLVCPFAALATRQGREHIFSASSISPQSDSQECSYLPTLFPDLYIPLMSLITYILAVGVIHGAYGHFHPQLLGSTATFASALMFAEVTLIQFCSYIFSGRIQSILEIISALGYKYVSTVLCYIIILITGGIKSNLFWIASLYLSISTVIVIYLTLSYIMKSELYAQYNAAYQKSGSNIVLYVASIIQIPILWSLLPSI